MADETVPHALAEHYPASTMLKHDLLERRGAIELWRTTATRATHQFPIQTDFQIISKGEWVMASSREDVARRYLGLETMNHA